MHSISQLAAEFGLSRSTLLYYDAIGLLHATARSESNYRRYSPEDRRRLEQVCHYRQIGISLRDIKKILDSDSCRASDLLEQRLFALNREINRLRQQQAIIIQMLKQRGLKKRARTMDKQGWISLLRATGLDDAAMKKWHREFEQMSPESHQDFLESLGLPVAEITRIREWSRG